MTDGFPVLTSPIRRTVRLVTTARLRQASLSALVGSDEAELALLAEIEGATSGRLIVSRNGAPSLSRDELVPSNVPNHHFINATFVYTKPRQLNRFSGSGRGAWYCAYNLQTALAEVAFHIHRELEATRRGDTVVEYGEMFATINGPKIDLTSSDFANEHCLCGADEDAYVAGNALAAQAIKSGMSGIIYPSKRLPGGTCVVALMPRAVEDVTQGDIHRLTWRSFQLTIDERVNLTGRP